MQDLTMLSDDELNDAYASAKNARLAAANLHRDVSAEVQRRAMNAIEADELRKVSERIGKKVQIVGPLGSDNGTVGTPGA